MWLAPHTGHSDESNDEKHGHLVHHGFQQSWLAGGLSRKVLQRIKEVTTDGAAGGNRMQVLCTGEFINS